ncbi:MAG: hypothetical protein AB8H86_24585 [Polyangiales bacterium]
MTWALVGVAVSVLCGGVLWLWTREGRQGGASREDVAGPVRWTLVLRLAGDDEAFARSILERVGDEDQLVDFMRLVPSATHFYAGEWISSLRCDLAGGVLLRLDASHVAGAVSDLSEVLALVRGLSPDANAELSVAESKPQGQPLRCVDESQRPGHRQCAYCRHSFVLHELECPSCGAAVDEISS